MASALEIIQKARTFIGTPYRYGGSSPTTGFDCSGFLFYVFNQFGIDIGRTTYIQITKGSKITKKEDLLPGDLIFYLDENNSPYHVVMYTGDNKIIESPRTGLTVRETTLIKWNGVARRIITPQPATIVSPAVNPNVYFRVVCGTFNLRDYANKRKDALTNASFDSFLVAYQSGTSTLFRIICGSFENRDLAQKRVNDLKNKGFDSFLLVV